ncbi:thiamine pyrophosphate-dependent dehydrogenase E1 component subunit alpha [Desulfoferula mesophila]|uniref:Pyruvate dehydrogenase E1 component subunit alpha n=1 Tax=Desulfoferula mesophila TaxID=3058419 RepID=A0AAU9EVJ0_9BACT|nr:pyruvate dehydrogenase E1 component subunit alpha [Desulfoferula mesophilus]
MDIPSKTVRELYRTMVVIRAFEEKVQDLYARGHIPGLAHLYIGEEAIAAGVCANLGDRDYITSTHRGHGHVIAKGALLKPMMAELYGKETGYCKGKGGSMHIADVNLGILGANGIAGGGLPIAVGAGLSCKMKYPGQVTVCFFGDASSNNGTFHESLNFAAVHKLPVIFVCENNGFGISVSQKQHQAIVDISVRAAGYNMPGITVDGNDVLSVYLSSAEAIERARQGEGPTLLEYKTYRWRGHHEGDPNQGGRYRTKEDIQAWVENCPIKRLEAYLTKNKVMTKKQMQAVWDEVEKEIDDSIEFAEQSPFPPLEEMFQDVLA